ncbi:RICIN domain-containing protein [Kibdelosporangium lantanae]|uniref:RICIN domain-containing protein n=1 Tax=Kibdelosporangium lantanae TaxID=1497396 RepID=A0ABW3MNG9_9PSEU
MTPDRDGTLRVRNRVFTGTYELRDTTTDTVIQPTKPESDLIEFTGQAGHTYRVTGKGSTSGPVETGVYYRLVAQHSGKFADINGGSTAAGATLIQWSATSGLNQQFDFLDSGSGYYRIRARHSNLVLTATSNNSGADIAQQQDTNANNQQWKVTVDQGTGALTLTNRQSGLTLGTTSTADGAHITQSADTSSTSQRFQLQTA